MSFKTIFLAMDTGPDNGTDLDQAVAISEGFGAHLRVLVLGVATPPPASPYGAMISDVWTTEIDQGQEAARQKAAEVTARLEAKGCSASSVETMFIDRGTVPMIAARHARYADLTLIGSDASYLQELVLSGALFDSGRPVLLLPSEASSVPKFDHVLIAWDASVEASKAVRDSISLMKAATSVEAVLIDPVPSFDGHGAEPGADLAAYLARHGISTTVHQRPGEGQDAGHAIIRAATDLGADLIVMGGFGHSRLRERIFGGCTTTMTKQKRFPVLMAH